MKIFRFDTPTDMALMADSCVRNHRQPLFLPEGDWTCELRRAIRIDRLGKEIPLKFSHRYYGAHTVVNYLRPTTSTDDRRCDALDDALVAGEWRPVDDDPSFDTLRPLVDALVEYVSRGTTLKHGDIIVLPYPIDTYKPHINQTVEADDLLRFTIK